MVKVRRKINCVKNPGKKTFGHNVLMKRVLFGQMANLFGQCPMTDDYLQPCNVRLILYFIKIV